MTDHKDKVIVLPSKEEIIERLKKVNDDDYMVKNFYPLIAQEADRELVATGVVMMLTLKIHDFGSSGFPPAIGNILTLYTPHFIEALIDDKDVAEEAKMLYQEALDATKK